MIPTVCDPTCRPLTSPHPPGVSVSDHRPHPTPTLPHSSASLPGTEEEKRVEEDVEEGRASWLSIAAICWSWRLQRSRAEKLDGEEGEK